MQWHFLEETVLRTVYDARTLASKEHTSYTYNEYTDCICWEMLHSLRSSTQNVVYFITLCESKVIYSRLTQRVLQNLNVQLHIQRVSGSCHLLEYSHVPSDKLRCIRNYGRQWRTEGGGWGVQIPPTPRNSEVLTKLSRIPSSVENTSIRT